MKTKKYDIIVHDTRPDFDRACESAYKQALYIFKINEDGHCEHKDYKDDFLRTNSSINVQFITYISRGYQQTYKFQIWMEKEDLEDE